MAGEKQNINVALGKLRIWSFKTCGRCGARPSEARLNIEGVIHHGCKLLCIDHEACQRRMHCAKRKAKKHGC